MHSSDQHMLTSRGHLLKRSVWERLVATLDRGGGGANLKLFRRNNFYNLLYENHNFPYFYPLFLNFLWRCGNAVPTPSGGMGTPFPSVPLGNDPCLQVNHIVDVARFYWHSD